MKSDDRLHAALARPPRMAVLRLLAAIQAAVLPALGTSFMVTPNETYPLCQSKQQVKVGMITNDTVDVAGAGTIVETGFGALAGSNCTVMVFSADAAGFAEMRVSCT